MLSSAPSRGRLLVLWNQIEEDVYEKWRADGPVALDWDPTRFVPDVGTVAEEMADMIRALRTARFEVVVVNIEDSLERLMGAIRLYRPDAVFNLIEYFNDDQIQEAYVAGLYDMLGTPFTGSPAVTLATCNNKFRTKLILEANDIPTSPFFLARSVPIDPDHELEYPLICKPAFEDASGGITPKSVVHNHEELERQVSHILAEFEMPALVEMYIEGREIHCALMGNNPPEVLPLFEMDFDDSEFNPEGEWRPQMITFKAKWDPHSTDFYSMDAVVPAPDLDPETEEYIREIAVAAYKAVGCRDYARVDMRLDEDHEPYILEINPNPDLVDGAAYMMCATASGRTYAETLGEIVDAAIARGKKRVSTESALPSDDLLRGYVVKKREPNPSPLPGEPLGAGEKTADAPVPGDPILSSKQAPALADSLSSGTSGTPGTTIPPE